MIDDQGLVHVKHVIYDKWERAQEAQKIFNSLNIKYSVYNNGSHWKIDYNDQEIDYWPTTGKWYIVDTKHKCTHDERFLAGILRYMGYDVKEMMN